jgi:hypothetical protein
MIMPFYTPIVTLLAIAFYFFLATRVAVAHGTFNVKLPATTGNSDFERIFRVHMNMLEWMPTFLVPLWLCAIYLNDDLIRGQAHASTRHGEANDEDAELGVLFEMPK